LIEIANLVQLASRELTDLWAPKPAGHSVDHKNHLPGRSFARERFAPRTRTGGLTLPTSRADHATRILLGDMAALANLSAEDHAMLCELSAPHGPLFVWLESQLHEHGAQPWVALREGLRGKEIEDVAVRLMAGYELDNNIETAESRSELRNLLNRMLADRLKTLETEAIQAAKADPNALQRYRELQARRLTLEAMPARQAR
jgi:DNA primase